MAHFAKLGTGNIVEKVLVVSNDIATTEKAGEDFLNSIKATSIATNKYTNQISLILALGEVFLKSINQSDSKTVHAPLKTAEYDGEKISIGFNATYLKEAITNYPTEDILFVFKDELSATLLLPETKNHKITILLMPVRINE